MRSIKLAIVAALLFTSCNSKEMNAELVDAYQTKVKVQNVPNEKKAGDTVFVQGLKQNAYDYVYVDQRDSIFASYKAVLK